jgi:hypothetical protein
MRAALALLVLAVLLAGCSSPTSPGPTQTPPRTLTAEERLDVAEADLLRAFEGEGGDVQRMNGTAGESGFQATLDMEFGSNDVLKVGVSFGGFFSATFYCSPGKSVAQLGEKVLESRGEGRCRDITGEDTTGHLTGEGNRSRIESSEATDDGGLKLVVRETNETGSEELRTVWLDKANRVVHMSSLGDDGTMDLWVSYGPKRAITVPTPNGRTPADVEYNKTFDEDKGVYAWEASSSEDNATLGEFEVRVIDRNEDENVTLATFRLTGAPQEEGGFRFQFTDSGDGKLGAGDRFTLRNADWEFEFEHDVVVFDTWAQKGIDEADIPGPGLLEALGVLAVVGLAAGARRRR